MNEHAEELADFEAAGVRKAKVEQHEIGWRCSYRPRSRPHEVYVETFPTKACSQWLADGIVVLDHQHTQVSHSSPRRSGSGCRFVPPSWYDEFKSD